MVTQSNFYLVRNGPHLRGALPRKDKNKRIFAVPISKNSGLYLSLEEKGLKQWVFIYFTVLKQEKKVSEKAGLSLARKGQIDYCKSSCHLCFVSSLVARCLGNLEFL